MRDWEKKRNDEVSEHVLVTHIVCLLLFLMIVFIYFDIPLGLMAFNIPSISILMVCFCLFTVLYISRNILSKIPVLSKARIEEVLLLVILFPLTFAFVWYSKDFMGAKMLIIVPVIITTTAFGKLPGLGAAALSSTLLFLIDYKLFPTCPPDIFQSSLIVSSIAIILAWLVGGLLKAERETQRDLIKLADYEQLTGLYNHRYLHEKLTLSIQDAVIKKTPLSLALLDIDQFKYYNSRYGYQIGDQLLAAAGEVLRRFVQEPSYAARYGGDEFMLVYPGKNKSTLRCEVENIKRQIIQDAESIIPSDQEDLQPLSISLGFASFPDDGDAVLPLIRSAENDIYRAKYSKGTNYLYRSVLSEINALKITEAFPALQAFISLINAKDRYTFGHSERVMTYALALAEKMNFPERDLNLLRYGAALHDIGKIKIETSILSKPSALNKQEWKIMQKHTIWGAQLVETLPAFEEIIPLIRSHHENYDGSGYPDGLMGEEIPILSRILRIADSFDAMTTDRAYRKAMNHAEACQELREKTGTYYDPQLVDLFIAEVEKTFVTAH